MAENKNELALSTFYSEENLKITEIIQQPKQIFIKMKSVTHRCICPECKQETNKYHGTYIRKVQDLPILGKRVLRICVDMAETEKYGYYHATNEGGYIR